MSRGCGLRVTGGIYWEARVAEGLGGPTMMDFVVDPPIRLNGLEVTPIGVKMFERDGVWHVIDWVGEQHYPNVADFVEEARHMGVSRRMPRSLEFEKLTAASRLLLVHRRAWVNHREPYYAVPILERMDCLSRRHQGILRTPPESVPMCASIWWADITDVGGWRSHERYVRRSFASTSYQALRRPERVSDPGYEPAVFMSVPMTDLAVIHDERGNRHEAAMERLEGIDRVYLVPR